MQNKTLIETSSSTLFVCAATPLEKIPWRASNQAIIDTNKTCMASVNWITFRIS